LSAACLTCRVASCDPFRIDVFIHENRGYRSFLAQPTAAVSWMASPSLPVSPDTSGFSGQSRRAGRRAVSPIHRELRMRGCEGNESDLQPWRVNRISWCSATLAPGWNDALPLALHALSPRLRHSLASSIGDALSTSHSRWCRNRQRRDYSPSALVCLPCAVRVGNKADSPSCSAT